MIHPHYDRIVLESVDLYSLYYHGSSLRQHKFPSSLPRYYFWHTLGTCNGLVFLSFDDVFIYAWNPSTSLFKKLPVPADSLSIPHNELSDNEPCMEFYAFGVGYLPDTDDYRVLVISLDYVVAMFSSKVKAWKRLEIDLKKQFANYKGCFVKEALHWVKTSETIMAFDFSQEEKYMFREMLLPPGLNDEGNSYFDNNHGVSTGGHLCVVNSLVVCRDSVDIWVLEEYGVCDSWTKHFNLKLSHLCRHDWTYHSVFVMETCIFVEICSHVRHKKVLHEHKKIGKNQEEACNEFTTGGVWFCSSQYQESLLQIED